MSRRTTAIASSLSILAIGSSLISSCANPATIKFNNSAKTKYAQGDYQGAISDYNKVLELDPQDSSALDNRASSKYQLGDYQGAIADSDKSLKINPQSFIAIKLCGLIFNDLSESAIAP